MSVNISSPMEQAILGSMKPAEQAGLAVGADALYRHLVENLPDPIALTDALGQVVFANAAYARLLGCPADHLAGTKLFDGVSAEDAQALAADVAAIAQGLGSRERDLCLLAAEGHRWLSWKGCLQPTEDGASLVLSVAHDVTERRRLHESELQARQEQHRDAATLRSITEAIPTMVAVVGPDERYRFANTAFARWHGRSPERLIGMTMREVLGATLYERGANWQQRAFSGERVVFEHEGDARNPDEHLEISYIPLWLDVQTVDGFVVVVQDVTAQKREEKRLTRLSQRDRLTGLLNRAGLEGFLDEAMADRKSDGRDIGLLYIDLDRFKPVNDTHGHGVGDELLKLFSRRLMRLVRPSDAVVRLGGDEFAIVLKGLTDISGIALVADKIVAMASQQFAIGDVRVSIGASVGYAMGLDRSAGCAGLLNRADSMLYQAKASGRGRSVGTLLTG